MNKRYWPFGLIVGVLVGMAIPAGMEAKVVEPATTLNRMFNVVQFAVYGVVVGVLVDVFRNRVRLRYSVRNLLLFIAAIVFVTLVVLRYVQIIDRPLRLWYSLSY